MPDPVDDLYERPPGEFVAARNELVRELRREKKRDDAAEVAKLRRPNAAAWAVNQLARHHRAELDDLIGAGEELRSAHSDALAGGDPDTLRQAGRARRDAVARLVDVAAGILAQSGSDAEAHRGAIASTLDAASLDADFAEEVRRGRLTSELVAPSGFGGLDLGAVPPPSRTTPRDDDRSAERAARHRARQEAKERKAEAERAEARAAAAQRRLERAEAEVASAEQELSAARRRARTAAEEAAEAAEEAQRAAARAAGATQAADD